MERYLTQRRNTVRFFRVSLFIIGVGIAALALIAYFLDRDAIPLSDWDTIPGIGMLLGGGFLLAGAVIYYVGRFAFVHLISA
jgi:hypothetical protein